MPRLTPIASTLLVFCLLFVPAAGAQNFEYLPGATYDPAIPTLKQVLGYDWGERISMPEEVERYLHALAEAAPQIRLVRYTTSWEGRPLFYVIIA
ncbi:MAG TPA: hypothetical protein VJA25_07430, partial [Dehalococcoidia bacterium]|nr:hypothetical protein [Dehalococcoidia bacterium]